MEKSTSYSVWGGLPAVLASCGSFEVDRFADAALREMFDTLDHLTARCANCDAFDVIASALVESKLSAEAVNRVNSPLLDGLWRLVSGEDPDGVSDLIVSPPADQIVMLSRLLVPRWYKETVDFLGLWARVNGYEHCYDFWETGEPALFQMVSNPLVCAAGAGRHDLVRMLVEHDFVLDSGEALVRAAEFNDISSLKTLLAFKSAHKDISFMSSTAAWLAASHASRESLLLLLPISKSSFGSALQGACSADDVDLLEWLWTMRGSSDVTESMLRCIELAGPRCLKVLTTNPDFGCERLVGEMAFHLLECFKDPVLLDILVSSTFFVRPLVDVHRCAGLYHDAKEGRLTFAHLRVVIEFCVFSPGSRARLMLNLLRIAFEFNDLSSVSFLLSCGSVAQQLDSYPSSERSNLVHFAAATGNLAIVDVVLASWSQNAEEQARFQKLRAEGLAALQVYDTSRTCIDMHWTFIRIAARCGQLSALRASASQRPYLDHGSVKSSNMPGIPPLAIAIERNDVDMVGYLVQNYPRLLKVLKHADHSAPSLRAVCSAARCGHLEVLRLICCSERIQDWSACVPTILMESSFVGQVRVVEYVLEQLRLTKQRLLPYFSALLNALLNGAVSGHLPVCCCLVDALLECSNADGMFLQRVDRAMRYVKATGATGWYRLVRLLFESVEISINGTVQTWRSTVGHIHCDQDALFAAARSGQLSLVQYFLDCGVSMHRVFGEETAVQAASSAGQQAVVELLLSRGGKLPGHISQVGASAITASAAQSETAASHMHPPT